MRSEWTEFRAKAGGEERGYSLVELLIAAAIIAILSAIAIPSYREMVHKAQVVAAIGDIRYFQSQIDLYRASHGGYPESLDEVNPDGRRDPWGQPYEYLRIEGGGKSKGKGKSRKDKNLVPLNTDYDLYSKGRDENSQSPLTARASWDDIIRANNGGYVGIANNY